jgi:integrase
MDKNTETAPMMLAEDYQAAAEADNTKLAHEKDLTRFCSWGGSIPSTPEQVSAYLSEHAASHKPATLARWLASISVEHRRLGFSTPTRSIHVKKTLAGIRNVHGAKQRRVSPLCTDEIKAIVNALKDTPADVRNKALILVAFSGAMRGSEAVGLTVDKFRFELRGMDVDLGRTKTDSAGANSEITIPVAENPTYCPVLALKKWLLVANITEGPVFRHVDRHGNISPNHLTIQGLEKIVKRLATRIGLDNVEYSGHSLRAGLVTSAVRADKPIRKILEITRHAGPGSLTPYIRDAEKYEQNAAGLL